MFRVIKKIFIGLLTAAVSASDHTKSVLLSNQKCMTEPTLNLHEYSRELHYYPFAVKLDRYVESCKTLNDLSNKVCIPNKTEGLYLKPVQHDYRNKLIRKKISRAHIIQM